MNITAWPRLMWLKLSLQAHNIYDTNSIGAYPFYIKKQYYYPRYYQKGIYKYLIALTTHVRLSQTKQFTFKIGT